MLKTKTKTKNKHNKTMEAKAKAKAPTEPRGVSTVCWGPELWQILHALSFRLDLLKSPHAAALASSIVSLLSVLLPCHFCRDSWPVFVAALEKSSGTTVRDHVARGTFARFLYDAHNLVNDKLMRQRWADTVAKLAHPLSVSLSSPRAVCLDLDEARVSRALQDAAEVAGVFGELDKRPSFECAHKRFLIAGNRPFPPAAVWRVLLLFSLNFSADKADAFVAFLRALAQGVLLFKNNECSMDTVLSASSASSSSSSFSTAVYSQLAVTLRVVAETLDQEGVLTQERVFERLVMGQASCEDMDSTLTSRRDVSAHIDALRARVEVAAAGACVKGVCK